MKLIPTHPDYPRILNQTLRDPPAITVSGPLDLGTKRVAIVGGRTAIPAAQDFAHRLAYHLAKAGVTIVSGGAVGVDRRAHDGARKAGGTTWVVACSGKHATAFPEEHADFFAEVAQDERSRMIWPFADEKEKSGVTPRLRNKILVGLAEYVVVVQARPQSGSLHAANLGHEYRKPVYIVPGSPWEYGFGGSIRAGVAGGQVLWSLEWFLEHLDLPTPELDDPAAAWNGSLHTRTSGVRRRRRSEPIFEQVISPVHEASWSDDEQLVFSCTSPGPTQQDDIIAKTGLGTSSTLTALLTLSLKDVLVEGPDGFFRRRNAP